MGVTYKAYDTNLRFPVALKVISSAYLENDTARQRFLREARAAAALRHPNVASVFNLGEVQEKYFYVMEFIDGETLEARVKREGPLRPVEALNIALQVTRALAAAAKQQLVHRDLKPTNLMLIEEEGELTVKVIDFGLAKITKETGEESAALTMGGFVGTPHFASPEQVEDGDIDIRSDIYSLGATLYFVLTGQSPFSGSIGQVMSQHLYKPLPLEPLKDQPRCVASLVQRMMAKDPNARPQTPQELQKEILACLTEIRGMSTQDVPRIAEAISPSETIDMSVAPGQPLAPGVTIAQVYYLVEEIGDSPLGRRFLADDLLHRRQVSLLVLSPDLLANNSALTSLRETVHLVRKAPHPMLQEIYALETFTDYTLLAEECITGISLLDVLRVRGALTAPEIVRLLSLLTPLADPARLSVKSQLARLSNGRISPAKFDYQFLRFHSAVFGTRALALLASTANAEVRARAAQMLATRTPIFPANGEPDPALTERAFSHAAIYPKGSELPQGLDKMDSPPTDFGFECLRDGAPCEIYLVPYGENRDPLVLVRPMSPDNGRRLAPIYGSSARLFQRDPHGKWINTGTFDRIDCPGVIDALRAGQLSWARPEHDDLMANGVRLEFSKLARPAEQCTPPPKPSQPTSPDRARDAEAPGHMGPAFGKPG